LFLAKQAGFKVAEVPVSWAHDRRTRIHPIADGLRMVCEILRIRWHAFRGSYGKSFVAPSSHSVAGNPGSAGVAESQAGD
jgi:dolichyl-phosphate beta-glucosyltransferase